MSTGTIAPVIAISRAAYTQIIGLALDEYPLEMCGLIAGPAGGPRTVGGVDATAPKFYPCTNDAASARVYTVNAKDHMLAERDAEDHDLEINGVVHSHTHSEPYPSPTDVAAAIDPSWHYVIVSLKREQPELRSYRIVDGQVAEEPVVIA